MITVSTIITESWQESIRSGVLEILKHTPITEHDIKEISVVQKNIVMDLHVGLVQGGTILIEDIRTDINGNMKSWRDPRIL